VLRLSAGANFTYIIVQYNTTVKFVVVMISSSSGPIVQLVMFHFFGNEWVGSASSVSVLLFLSCSS
jgi:hypothetical protein